MQEKSLANHCGFTVFEVISEDQLEKNIVAVYLGSSSHLSATEI